MLVALNVAVCAEQGIIIMHTFVRSAACSRSLAGAYRSRDNPQNAMDEGCGQLKATSIIDSL